MVEPRQRHVWRWAIAALVATPFAIVVGVYLAAQVLLPSAAPKRITYSEAKELVRESPERVDLVVFKPRTRELDVRLVDGETYESHYPSDASQLAFEELLDENGVEYDAYGSGESSWLQFATYALPFMLVAAAFTVVIVFLIRKTNRRS